MTETNGFFTFMTFGNCTRFLTLVESISKQQTLPNLL